MRFVFVLLLLFPLCLAAAEPEGVTAPSYLLVEMDTLQIIVGKDYHKRLPPASTTKVMTTLLAIEKLEGNETITPGKEVLKISPSKMNLVPGKGYKSIDLMKGAMVESANDAAYALGVYIGGTESNFAAIMNEKARALGAIDTNFINASGLPVDDQFTTCYDLAIIFKQALLSPRFREIVSIEYFLFQDAYKRVQYKNHNRLLFCFEPSIGGKTGYTRKARHCYVGAFEKDGKVYILTLLGSRNLWGDTVQILKTLYDRVPTDEELRLAKYCSTSLTSHRVKKPVKPTAKKKVSRIKRESKQPTNEMKFKHLLSFALILVFATSSLSFALTYDEEKKYGKEIYREIIQAVPVNNDPYISLTVDNIKKRLEEKALLPFPVTLTIIDAESIDAFATMGGYVYITTGLIGMCDKEEELAGVVAHEFAHIKKRHIAKRMEKEKYINIGMIATMLVGMLVGGGSTPEAIITSGIAGAQAMSLKYSREDEEEADREGSTIADKAGYGGLGSAMFLKKLRTAGADKLLPQYLLTHPYHEARITFLESMWEKNRVTIEAPLFPYLALRAQILHKSARVGGDDIIINRYLKDKADPVNNYAACLVYSLKGNADESIRIAGENKSSFKNLFLGEMFINARKFPEAVDVLKAGTEPIARFLLAKAYEGQSKNEMAVSTLKEIVSYGSIFPEIYYRLGMLYGRTKEEARGYDYLGRFYLETGKFTLAKTNLEKAVSRYGINSPEAKETLQLLDSIKNEKK